MGTEAHSEVLPRVEVVANGDRAACALGLTNGPELAESGGSLDGRCVDSGGLVDVVVGPV